MKGSVPSCIKIGTSMDARVDRLGGDGGGVVCFNCKMESAAVQSRQRRGKETRHRSQCTSLRLPSGLIEMYNAVQGSA